MVNGGCVATAAIWPFIKYDTCVTWRFDGYVTDAVNEGPNESTAPAAGDTILKPVEVVGCTTGTGIVLEPAVLVPVNPVNEPLVEAQSCTG